MTDKIVFISDEKGVDYMDIPERFHDDVCVYANVLLNKYYLDPELQEEKEYS